MNAFDFRPTLNAPDDDPYLWLENVEGERPLAWAASQSARTLGHFGVTQFGRAKIDLLQARLVGATDRSESASEPLLRENAGSQFHGH
ncbi:hypothetical protein NKH75_28500 [Mesorhizobium sp. M0984]|uniref:hypothetical protein n=1 Tax=unclassified Mesorhizobium TaxID=325217 RepID=UPI00333C9942